VVDRCNGCYDKQIVQGEKPNFVEIPKKGGDCIMCHKRPKVNLYICDDKCCERLFILTEEARDIENIKNFCKRCSRCGTEDKDERDQYCQKCFEIISPTYRVCDQCGNNFSIFGVCDCLLEQINKKVCVTCKDCGFQLDPSGAECQGC
jgi:hypothetical protein